MQQAKISIYQVIPRLFGNTGGQKQPHGTRQENGCGKLNNFTPQALEAIKEMGFTHIWYIGLLEHATKEGYPEHGIQADPPELVKGQAGSPYAVKDYYDIAPDLAEVVPQRMQEFSQLVDRTHQAGLKMLMDFVPNHVARTYHSDAKPNGTPDFGDKDNKEVAFFPDNNFYYLPGESLRLPNQMESFQEMPAKATGNDSFTATPGEYDWYETIKLNYGVDYLNHHTTFFTPTPNTWLKMRDILLYWADKGVDGFRCDMAEMVPVEFWQWVIPEVKEKYPSVIFIAEIYKPHLYSSYIRQGGFDYLYDKVGLYDTLKGVIQGHHPASDITGCWQALEGIQHKMLNFMENHDEQRIASRFFANDALRGLPGFLICATFNQSSIMVYFGQELGEPGMDQEGFSGEDGRTSIFDYWKLDRLNRWINDGSYDETKLTREEYLLRHRYMQILHLAMELKALREGAFYDLMWRNMENPHFDNHNCYAFCRYTADQIILIVACFNPELSRQKVIIPEHAWECMGQQTHGCISWKNLLNPSYNGIHGCREHPLDLRLKKGIGGIYLIRQA